jgi:hypothetical protein
VLTASVSTFGWWTAYLASKDTQIFYNYQTHKAGKKPLTFTNDDYFLINWIGLEYNQKNNIIRQIRSESL